MIISQTSLRISFVGGGTDFEDFYCQYPGRILSTSIDKYFYIGLNSRFGGKILGAGGGGFLLLMALYSFSF